ncbi:TPA: DUF4422 domain-containing protein [Aeromonas sobria]|nr:DUF4422 domain-containing protein [Aeromonas sobria]
MNIYIATHKPYEFPKDNQTYIPIEVGAELRKEHFCTVLDNTGLDNISHKNKSFCELTAIYWMLKNNTSDHIGLVHYRRYFKLGVKREGRFYGKWHPDSAMAKSDFVKILSSYDLIIPERIRFQESIECDYKKNHIYDDYVKVRNVINDKSPEFIKYFDGFSNQHHIHTCNMFVMSSKYFELCWQWIFSIIFEFEHETDISQYDEYQRRVFGFISERLFNVWVLYAIDVLSLRVYESGVINLEAKSKLAKILK